MNYQTGKNMLEEKGLVVSSRRVDLSWKKTRSHNFHFESFEHYIAKAILVYLINKKSQKGERHGALSEYEIPSGRRIDVLHLIQKGKELVGYEIQTSDSEKTNYPEEIPMLEINLDKSPIEVKKAFKILEDYFKEFVV